MKNKEIQPMEALDIDLQRLLRALRNQSMQIGMVAVVCAVAAFLGSCFLFTPRYRSDVMFYVNNNSASQPESSGGISSADISASRGLVQSGIVILNSLETLDAVIETSGADRSYTELQDMICAEAVDATEFFRVTVTGPDPQEAVQIADAIAQILPERISGILEGSSVRIVDAPVAAAKPCTPGHGERVAAGFLIGLGLAAGWVVLCALTDTTICSVQDITQCCGIPVLAVVPDPKVRAKGGRKCDDSDKRRSEADAYKLLYTRLELSFGDAGGCKVIGMTGVGAGVGRSLSAVNFARGMSRLGKRVLLVDCDMRRFVPEEKRLARTSPGLSDFLRGNISADRLPQPCGCREEGYAFRVISSGPAVPDPMELLLSGKMEELLEHLGRNCDYIILDLPPLGESYDALAAARLTDGMLLVVSRNCCDRFALDSALSQLSFVGSRVLGILFQPEEERKIRCGRYEKQRR